MPNEFISIEVSAERLIRRYETGNLVAQQLLANSMQQAVDHTALDASVQPPLSEANAPPPPYYIRGIGTQYANKNRLESQQLSQRWQKLVELVNNGAVGIVKNLVSYAPWVHASFQRDFHAARKWRTIGAIATSVTPHINEIFKQAGAKLADYLNGKGK